MPVQEVCESLLRIVGRFDGEPASELTLILPWSLRQRSRFRTRLDDGRDVGVFLARGETLRDGDRLGGWRHSATHGCSTSLRLRRWGDRMTHVPLSSNSLIRSRSSAPK